jgi:hypothetical protein
MMRYLFWLVIPAALATACGGKVTVGNLTDAGAGGSAGGGGSGGSAGTAEGSGGKGGSTIPPSGRHCPSMRSVQPMPTVSLPSLNASNVWLGSAVFSSNRLVFSWGSRSCCGMPIYHQVGLFSIGPDGSQRVGAYFGNLEVPGSDDGLPPPFTPFAEGFLVIQSIDGAHIGTVVDAATLSSTLDLEVPSEVSAGIGVPALASRSGGLMALLPGSPTLLRLTEALAIVDKTDLDSKSSADANLVTTPTGAIATWAVHGTGGTLSARALSADGSPAGSVVVLSSSVIPWLPVRVASWDGASVLTSDGSAIFEISAEGKLVARTPAPAQPWAAVGLQDSVLVIVGNSFAEGRLSGRLLRLERTTGKELQDLGAVQGLDTYVGTATVASRPGEVVFGVSSYDTRDRALLIQVLCE